MVQKNTFLRTHPLVSLKPVFLRRWFFRPPPNHLKFCAHVLLNKHRANVKVLQIFEFSNIYRASVKLRWKHRNLPQRDNVNFQFSVFLWYSRLIHVRNHVQKIWGDLEMVEKITFLGTHVRSPLKPVFLTRWFFQPPPNHLKFCAHFLLNKHRWNVMVL